MLLRTRTFREETNSKKLKIKWKWRQEWGESWRKHAYQRISDDSIDKDVKSSIEKEFSSYSLSVDSKISYDKVNLDVYRHFLNFGKMKVKMVSRESFVKQHVSRDLIKLKFLNCSGHNLELNGFEVCYKRLDKSTLPMMIKCSNYIEDLTVIGIPPDNKEMCHIFSSSINSEINCKQVSPIVHEDDVFKFSCSLNYSRFDNRRLSPHIIIINFYKAEEEYFKHFKDEQEDDFLKYLQR